MLAFSSNLAFQSNSIQWFKCGKPIFPALFQNLAITLYIAVFIYLLKGLFAKPLKSLMMAASLRDKLAEKEFLLGLDGNGCIVAMIDNFP